MCGISGFWSKSNPISGKDFYFAHRKMANRGPDDEGFVVFENGKFRTAYGNQSIDEVKFKYDDICALDNISLVLGHVRLSIIDLTSGGHQPVVDMDRKLAMSYNGEIYNYRELRDELEKKGWTFKTNSDTEVLFRAYQEWGKDCFNRLNGMWAVAFYDGNDDTLTLSRDRFGVKPLFYRVKDGKLSFASEMKVICMLWNENRVNMRSVDKYISSTILCESEEAFIEDIYEVSPGYCISFCNGELTEKFKYWNYTPDIKPVSMQEAVEIFDFLFRDSIRLRMRSDVEVGSLLSGGLDSNVIAGTLYDEKLVTHTYKTFSSVYEDEKYSERKYIEKTVGNLELCSDFVYMTADKVMDCLDNSLENSEMPTRAVPMMLQYLLYQRIREYSKVKVVLNGQGADELFGGYNVDYVTRFLQLWYEKRFVELVGEVKEYRKNRSVALKQIAMGMYRQSRICKAGKSNAFNEISFYQVTSTPLREYLMYDDRAAMAFGIENRAPFLDYRLVEFAFSLSSDLKVNRQENKAVVRRFAKGIVDDSILNRKDKMGFTSPQEIWQRREWAELFDETFLKIESEGIFDMHGDRIHKEYTNYKNSNRVNWAKIWRYFCLYRWAGVAASWKVK